jgi:hypothetical protein
MSNTTEAAIFTRVTVRSDRERVFSRLIADRAVFSFQSHKKLYKGRVFDREGRALLFDLLDNLKLITATEIVASFMFGNEVYFLKTQISPRGNSFLLDIGQDLYKLQRRDNFRLVMPTSQKARFELRSIDIESVKQTYGIVDLSGGGLSFEMLYATDRLQQGSHVSGVIKIGENFSKPVVGLVRHVRPFGSMGSGLFRVGIQFEGLSSTDHEEIILLVMKIHRIAFSKFKIA